MSSSKIKIHKFNTRPTTPDVSIILLDWSCRERFHTLTWLSRQNVPRESYELIWVELHDRVVPTAMDACDVVITCGQRGIYHKHKGYNIGLLHSRGRLVTICDSDAIFPETFVESITRSFDPHGVGQDRPLVLMHYEWRSLANYPDDLTDLSQLSNYEWMDLWPNAGACMTVRRKDAIGFGGFDEHRSYRGYMCGPYDLGWRMMNADVPEIWHDPSVALWHFAHPDPYATSGDKFSWKLWKEIRHPHVNGHALMAVEAFSTGRLLPRKERPEIFAKRMNDRLIGSDLEKPYGHMFGRHGVSFWRVLGIRLTLTRQMLTKFMPRLSSLFSRVRNRLLRR